MQIAGSRGTATRITQKGQFWDIPAVPYASPCAQQETHAAQQFSRRARTKIERRHCVSTRSCPVATRHAKAKAEGKYKGRARTPVLKVGRSKPCWPKGSIRLEARKLRIDRSSVYQAMKVRKIIRKPVIYRSAQSPLRTLFSVFSRIELRWPLARAIGVRVGSARQAGGGRRTK
jgi:hypothetical protein